MLSPMDLFLENSTEGLVWVIEKRTCLKGWELAKTQSKLVFKRELGFASRFINLTDLTYRLEK